MKNSKNAPKFVDRKPSEMHSLFFEYLLISPSYYLAYKQLFLGERVKRSQMPERFNEVLKLCDRAGDIYNVSFDDWWDEIGIDLLAPERRQRTVLYRLDLTLSKNQILNNVEIYLDGLKNANTSDNQQIKFLTNKIRLDTLRSRLNFVHSKVYSRVNVSSEGPALLPKKKHWELAIESSHFEQYRSSYGAVIDIKDDLSRNKKNKKQIAYLTMLFSKSLKEALYISENAARGNFPSKELLSCPDFDYVNLLNLLTDQAIAHVDDGRFEGGVQKYYNRFLKSIRKRASKKEMLDKIEFQAEKRARQKLNNPDYF